MQVLPGKTIPKGRARAGLAALFGTTADAVASLKLAYIGVSNMQEMNSMRHTIDASVLPTQDLIKNIGKDFKTLADLELRLVQAEAKADIAAEVYSAKLGAIGLVCALLGLNLVAVAVVLLFAPKVAWLAALFMAALFFGGAAYAALQCKKYVHKNPLGQTRETLKEDVEWIRSQVR